MHQNVRAPCPARTPPYITSAPPLIHLFCGGEGCDLSLVLCSGEVLKGCEYYHQYYLRQDAAGGQLWGAQPLVVKGELDGKRLVLRASRRHHPRSGAPQGRESGQNIILYENTFSTHSIECVYIECFLIQNVPDTEWILYFITTMVSSEHVSRRPPGDRVILKYRP
jgi:hypothetical protein